MNKFILISVFTILMSFSQCDKSQMDKETPSKIVSAKFQNWVGGQPGSKGVLVLIKLVKPSNPLVFDSIYFNDQTQKIEVSSDGNTIILKGNFVELSATKHDLVLSSDPKEEFGNRPPTINKKNPFKLENDQAVISYFNGKNKRYFIVKNIKKEKAIYYQ